MSRDYRPWTLEEEASLRTWLVDEKLTNHEVAARLGRSVGSVRNKVNKLGVGIYQQARTNPAPLALATATIARRVDAGDDPAVTVLAAEESAEETREQFLARVMGRTDRAVAKARTEGVATVRIASAEPVGISFTSDWHLSSTGATDVRGLFEHARVVRETPRLYTAVIGDLLNNDIKHRGGAGPQSVPDELRAMDYLVGDYGSRMLWMTSGNHDDWSVAFAGVDSLAQLAKRKRILYAPDELVVIVEIVSPDDPELVTARWVIATRHKYRRHSNLNHSHACWRWAEDSMYHWPTDTDGRTLLPDVIVIGHDHVSTADVRTFPRGPVAALRPGPWQIKSSFSRAMGFAEAAPTAPTVILPPVRGDGLAAFDDYRKAARMLGGADAARAA